MEMLFAKMIKEIDLSLFKIAFFMVFSNTKDTKRAQRTQRKKCAILVDIHLLVPIH